MKLTFVLSVLPTTEVYGLTVNYKIRQFLSYFRYLSNIREKAVLTRKSILHGQDYIA